MLKISNYLRNGYPHLMHRKRLQYLFSKPMKKPRQQNQSVIPKQSKPQKQEQQQQRQVHQPNPKSSPNPEVHFLQKYPNFRPQTFAQKRDMNIFTQISPFACLGMGCLLFSHLPFCEQFIYSLFLADKFLALLIVTNLKYRTDWERYGIVGLIAATCLIPVTNVYSISAQMIQTIVLLSNDQDKINQSTPLTEYQQQLLKYRLKIKVVLFTCITTVFAFKCLYQVEKRTVESKFKEYNQMNKKLAGINIGNQGQKSVLTVS